MKRLLSWSAGLAVALMALQPAYAITQEAKLVGTELTPGALSGTAVSISGNTAVVGAPSEGAGAGGVYVFLKSGGVWTEQQHITASDASSANGGDKFGTSVSVDGDVLVVGAPGRTSSKGAVYTFLRTGTSWAQVGGAIEGSSTASNDQFGFSVSVQFPTLAVGAPNQTVAGLVLKGAVYAFTNSGGVWTQQQRISENKKNVKKNAQIGSSVSLSGNTIAAGAPGTNQGNKANVGAVFIYVRNGTVWTRQTRLNPGGAANDRVGSAVALFSNSLVIGAAGHDVGTKVNQGQAFVTQRTGITWGAFTTITAADGAAHDHFGTSVAIAGQFVVIGAPQNEATFIGTGKAYLYGFNPTLTLIDALIPTDFVSADSFGAAAAFDSNAALVGSPQADYPLLTDAGAAYVFRFAQTATTTVINSDSPDPSLAGQSYTVNVTVSGGAPTGTVDVDDGDGATCTITLVAADLGTGSCSLISVAPGPHFINASYNGSLVFASSSTAAPGEPHQVNGGDLGIVKDDGRDGVLAGGHVTYTITVTNSGTTDATGATVADTIPATLLNASWTCVASVGSTCTASGNGNINDSVNILAGGTATYTLDADVTATLGVNDVINTATVTAPAGFNDNNPNNDSSTDDDVPLDDLIFADSFE